VVVGDYGLAIESANPLHITTSHITEKEEFIFLPGKPVQSFIIKTGDHGNMEFPSLLGDGVADNTCRRYTIRIIVGDHSHHMVLI
jgi:hypothetical protein